MSRRRARKSKPPATCPLAAVLLPLPGRYKPNHRPMPASSKKRASRRGADGKPVFAPFCAVFPAHLSHEAEASSCRCAGWRNTPALLAAAKTQLPDSEPALRACPKRKNLWQTIVMYPSDMIDEQWSAKALSGKQACRQTPDAQPRDMLNAIFYAQATGYQ